MVEGVRTKKEGGEKENLGDKIWEKVLEKKFACVTIPSFN